MASRNELTEAVLGAPGREFGGAAACYAVTGALGTAAALVAGWPSRLDGPRRIAVLGIAAGFAVRGALGLAGHTNVLVPISTGARFRRLDRKIYSPVVLTLAGLTALSLGCTRGRRDEAVVKGAGIAPAWSLAFG
jgi:hypothetical protein